MTLLDISGAGLFGHSSQIVHAFGVALKLVAGSFSILLLAAFSLIGIVVYSIYKAYQTSDILGGARTLIHLTAYAIGISIALLFALIAGTFLSIAAAKLLFVTVLIACVVSFIVRETFLFLILKRFGKYVMYFTALRYAKQKVYNHAEQENEF